MRFIDKLFSSIHRLTMMMSAIALLFMSSNVQAADRQALVIGNSDYGSGYELVTPEADAISIAEKLASIGYEVHTGGALLDLDLQQFNTEIDDFLNSVEDGASTLVYYAGHGAASSGSNYLIPILPNGVKLRSESDIRDRSISLQGILERVEQRNPSGVNVLFFDACRDAPIENFSRSVNLTGLASLDTARQPRGSFIGFSTEYGNIALDNDGSGNSPFATAILETLDSSAASPIELFFKDVTQLVFDNTSGQQFPIQESKIRGSHCIVDCESNSGTGTTGEYGTLTVNTKPSDAQVCYLIEGWETWSCGRKVVLPINKSVQIKVTAESYKPYATDTKLLNSRQQLAVELIKEDINTPSASIAAPLSANCTAVLTTTTLKEDFVIPAGCYLVNRDIVINDGANLTISPDTVLSFSSGTELIVNSGGSLTADGTAQAPILFTAQDPTPGFWVGLRYSYSNSSRNILNNVTVQYGGNRGQNISIIAAKNSPSRVNISNSTIRNSSGAGISIAENTFLTFTNNTITDNTFPVRVSVNVAANLGTGSRFSGNSEDVIQLTGNALSVASTWQNQSVPYRLEGLTLNDALTVAAGVTLEFATGSRLDVSSEGSLNVAGSPAAPVIFTSEEKIPGFWAGIRFAYSGSLKNRLEHLVLEYAGNSGNTNAALTVISTTTGTTRLSADTVTIRESSGDGFNIGDHSSLSQFDNITSTSNARAGTIDARMAGSLGNGLSLTGNAEDAVLVVGSEVDRSESWNNHGVPYVIEGFAVAGAKLVLNPGVELLMQSGSSIAVQADGSLTIMGDTNSPVLISGLEPTPGYWRGIFYNYSNTVNNSIDNAVIRHAGSSGGNIRMSCTNTTPARLTISHTQLTDSSGLGISTSADTCILSLDDTVTFSNNAGGAY